MRGQVSRQESERAERLGKRLNADIVVRATLAVGAAILLAGVGLIVSARLDGAARTNIGVGLMTGVIVGGALSSVEFGLEQRRRDHEERERDRQREDLIDYMQGSVARLIMLHARELYMTIYMFREPLNSSSIVGFRGREDAHLVVRGVQWVADLGDTDADWYRSARTVQAVDVAMLVGSHLAEREGMHLGDRLELLRFLTEEAASRISGTADFLSQTDSLKLAQDLADVASNLAVSATTLRLNEFLGSRAAQLPRLEPRPVDDDGVTYIEMPSTDLQFGRESVAYLIDQLRHRPGTRTSRVQVEQQRMIDQADDDAVAVERWRELLTGHSPNGAWEQRFASDSWLRRVLGAASEQVQWNYGLTGRSQSSSSGGGGQ